MPKSLIEEMGSLHNLVGASLPRVILPTPQLPANHIKTVWEHIRRLYEEEKAELPQGQEFDWPYKDDGCVFLTAQLSQSFAQKGD